MSLYFDRSNLKFRLLYAAAFTEKEKAETLRLINKWWASYKLWELQDRFLAAFKEGRMTMRQAPGIATTYGNYQGKESETKFSANRGTDGKVEYPDERYRVDVGAMRERMDPNNFGIEGGERLKYQKGLHELSASLGVPTMPLLTKQMRWKPTNSPGKADNWIMVFMPLAQPEDMGLFFLLNQLSKQHPDSAIRLRVDEMRRRMTRLKFADSVDIGAGLRDIADPGSDPKLRYGLTKPLDALGRLNPEDQLRQQKAQNYTSILPNPSTPKPNIPAPSPNVPGGKGGPPPPPPGGPGKDTNTNEVVVAYRQHEGIRFPLFTQYQAGSGKFLCLNGDPSSFAFPKKFIPNNWAQAVEN